MTIYSCKISVRQRYIFNLDMASVSYLKYLDFGLEDIKYKYPVIFLKASTPKNEVDITLFMI